MKTGRRMGYRKPNERVGEQYTTAIPIEYIRKMGITPEDRNIEISFNEKTKTISIKKVTV